MAENDYSVTGLHLLENRGLSRKLKRISFTGGVSVLFISGVVAMGWLFNLSYLKNLFFVASPISPLTVLLFVMTSACMLPQFNSKVSEAFKKWYGVTILGCGIVVILLTVGNFFLGQNVIRRDVLLVNVSFFLVGLSYILSQTKIKHRFHIVQMLMLMVALLAEIIVLGFGYQLFLGDTVAHLLLMPVNISLLFMLLCHTILLKWPNRGFIGIFTTDTLTTKFSLRILVAEALVIPLIGLLGLLQGSLGKYSTSEILALVVAVMLILIGMFAWLNVKLLYKLDLEFFLMKEALRVNNITIKMSSEEMASKMIDLEKAKGEYENKLKYQDSFRDVAEGLS